MFFMLLILLRSKISQVMRQGPKHYKFKKKEPIRAFKEGTRPKSINQGPLKISERRSKPMNRQALGLRK